VPKATAIQRSKRNPLIKPEDVKPSQNNFEVFGVSNAGATKVNNKTLLILRVAERPKKKSGVVTVPNIIFSGNQTSLKIKKLYQTDKKYIFTDPRVVHENTRGKRIIGLTSISHLRLAWSDDGENFAVEDKPWVFPSVLEEAWGCEDPRVTKIENEYLVNYTAVSTHGIATALVKTKDFKSLERYGIIFSPPNRDVVIFPEKIKGYYAALHRPMPTRVGVESIWFASSPNLTHWGKHRFVMGPRRGTWDGEKIGGGAPPLLTNEGWLIIYHGVDEKSTYRLGAALLDLKEPWKVIARLKKPIVEPTEQYEKKGVFPNVCFTCGVTEKDNEIRIYYGGADRVMCLATVNKKELVAALVKQK